MQRTIDFRELLKPFKPDEVEWRLAQCGKAGGKIWGLCLAYITARAIMDRLDLVCGPENWKAEYDVLPTGILCSLSIRCGGEWVTKVDGAECTDIEPFKGGISSALKRAGSAWGMGRYLYSLENGFIELCEKNTAGAKYGKTKEGDTFYWIPPALPKWALPEGSEPSPTDTKSGLTGLGKGQPGPEDGFIKTDPEIIPFGKYRDLTFKEVFEKYSKDEVGGYLDYWDKKSKRENKPIEGELLRVLNTLADMLAEMETNFDPKAS